jgi:serine protease
LRSIDTTVNDGATTPGANSYTDQSNSNLGTSFSAPIVSGVAALMRAANANLTPPQLIARIRASATPYPQPAGLSKCQSGSTSSLECACTTATCGAGMLNAFSAVKAALNPIAAVKVPAGFTTGNATVDAGGSAPACGAIIVSYAWSSTGAVHIVSGAASATVNINSFGTGSLTLVVTDSRGNTDTAVVNFRASGATTAAPSTGGTAAGACVTPMTVTPVAPTVTEAFAPSSVAANDSSVLTLTFTNGNAFDLTQSGITVTLPADLQLGTTAPATTCAGANKSLSSGTDTVTLSGAIIPVNGSCDLTLNVTSATAGTYTNTVVSNALVTGPAGGNSAPASASLTVSTGSSSGSGASTGGGGGGGGGALDWLDIMLVAGVVLIVRGHARRTRR